MTSSVISDSDAPAPGRTRRNRGSEVVRTALINAAIAEFAANGFEGASTRRIAEAASAHQSQIKYHFDTKDDLWKRCIELLLDELDASIVRSFGSEQPSGDNPVDADDRAVFEATIRGLVHFMADRPELNRIMMHEATSRTSRLEWMVATHIRDRHASLSEMWERLIARGAVAPIDTDLLYHTIIGASTLIYTNAPEAELLGVDSTDPDLVQRHADALVALFLTPRPTKDHR